jgi:hypothetical protein
LKKGAVAAGPPPFFSCAASRLMLRHCGKSARAPRDDGKNSVALSWGSAHWGQPAPALIRRPAMLANNVVTILMIVFTWALVAGVAGVAGMTIPRALDRRKQRQIDELTAGAELLADAMGRAHNNPDHLARLTANYDAHARALTQLGQDVPPLATDAPVARAA